MKIKIKIQNIIPFEILANYQKCSTEEAVQRAYSTLLSVATLEHITCFKMLTLKDKKSDAAMFNITIDLKDEQQALFESMLTNKSMNDINDKVFELALGLLFLSDEAQKAIKKLLNG